MLEIKDLLFKFNKFLNLKDFKRKIIKEVLLEKTGIDINISDIKLENNVVFLNIKPILKNEIFLKKESILLELENKINNKQIKNIF